MPQIVIMRHGDAATSPEDRLATRSCLRILALVDAFASQAGSNPLIVCGEDRDSKVTAQAVAETLNGEVHTHSALSEDGTQDAENLLVGWIMNTEKTVVLVTHRRRVRSFYRALERVTGRRMKQMPSFARQLFELRMQAIAFSTTDMNPRIILSRRGRRPVHLSPKTEES